MQQHGSKYFAHRPQLLILAIGSKDRTSHFSEHDHVAYQIKGIQVCSNMVANILPVAIPPPDPGVGSKGQNSTFSHMVMLHINMIANILPADPHLPLGSAVTQW